METPYEGREMRVGYNEADSGVFGTPAADSDTFTMVPLEGFDMEAGLVGHEIPGAFGSKQPQHQGSHTTTDGAIPVFNTKGIMSLNEIDEYAYAHFQKVVEGDTPFTKVFTPMATHPDFSANAGHWLTWAVGFPVAATSHVAEGCIANRFKLSINRNEFMMMDVGWMGHGVTDVTSTVYEDGTWELGLDGPGGSDAGPDYGRVHWTQLDILTIDFDDVVSPLADAVCFQSIEMEMEYQIVDMLKPDGAGSFQSWGLAQVGGTFTITILKDSQAEAALQNVRTNSGLRIQINKGAAGATSAGEFESIMYGKISPDGIAYEKEGLIAATISGTMSAPNDSTDMWKVSLSNSIDRSWPAA